MIRAALLLALTCITSIAAVLDGQTPGAPIGVQGTMSLNATWSGAQSGAAFPGTDDGLRSGQLRFGGRAAARIGAGLFVGLSVASWQFDFTRFSASTAIDAVSEGVVVGPYLQLYPGRQMPIFVRAGAGYANTWAFVSGGDIIQGFRGNRVAATIGAGGDVALRRHLALTLSVDYTRLVHVTNYAESTSALIAGAGLTVR